MQHAVGEAPASCLRPLMGGGGPIRRDCGARLVHARGGVRAVSASLSQWTLCGSRASPQRPCRRIAVFIRSAPPGCGAMRGASNAPATSAIVVQLAAGQEQPGARDLQDVHIVLGLGQRRERLRQLHQA